MTIEFRPVSMNDAALLLRWRNDPLTRKMSRDTGEIAYDDHVDWLRKLLADPTRQIFIVLKDGQAVGTVRADRDDDVAEVSWSVAPECRGQGIGKEMVKQFCQYIGGRLRATVRPDNEASRQIALFAGMSRKNVNDPDFDYYEGTF